MKQVVWTQDYAVNSIVANAHKRLGLVGLLNILQDVAWVHAEHLGHGYEATMQAGAASILSRQTLVMSAWPDWGDELECPHLGPAGQGSAGSSRLRIAGRRRQGRRMHGRLADAGRENASASSPDAQRRHPGIPIGRRTRLDAGKDRVASGSRGDRRVFSAQQRPRREWPRQQHSLCPMDPPTRRRSELFIQRGASRATR